MLEPANNLSCGAKAWDQRTAASLHRNPPRWLPAAAAAGDQLKCGHDRYEQKITFGTMSAAGVRDVLIYCRDHKCSHSITISADSWPDHVRLSDVEPQFTYTACGKRGAELRPAFSHAHG